MSHLLAIIIALALLASALAWAWLITTIRRDAASAALAEEKTQAAERRAAEAVKAQEIRDETARASFDRAVDDL